MENKRRTGEIVAVVIIITAVLTFVSTSAYYGGKLPFKPSISDKLNKVTDILGSKYYQDIDNNALEDGAVRGMVDSLGDPYTTYMNKEEWDSFNTMISGTYSGVGLTITPDTSDNTIAVISAFDNSPAARANIVTGDKIIKVAGEAATGDKLDDAVAKMKGPKGTEVVLTVRKKDTGGDVDLTLVREDIQLNTVNSEMKGNLGYIRISMFDINTGDEFEKHLKTVKDSGAKGLIIDVRQNGGGVTTAVEKVADCLLPADNTIYYTSNRQGEQKYYKTKSGGVDLPIVVLIDEGTASASEILSAAVKDNGRGVLVGKKSFGKGLVQQAFSLGDGSFVKVTVEQYFTPSGNNINKKGIVPDFEVDLKSQNDEQLQKAIEILNQK